MSVDGEAGGIVIGADADPALVVANVVDAIGHGAPQFGVDKIMHIDRFWRALGAPFATVVFEIPHQLLLFGVDGNDRLTRRQKRRRPDR